MTQSRQCLQNPDAACSCHFYEVLADGIAPSSGYDGKSLRKVNPDRLRDEVKNRGFLEKENKGHIIAADRQNDGRAKKALLHSNRLVEDEGLIWMP